MLGRGSGRVNLQSQNEVWELLWAGRLARGRKVVAPLRVHLGKRKYQGLYCLSSAQRLGSIFLPTCSLFLSLALPLGPSPIRWLLGSVAKGPGQGRWGKRSGRLPPRSWLDGGLTAGAQPVPGTCCSPSCCSEAAAPLSGAPPSRGPVRGRAACKLGLGQAALVRTPTLHPPILPPIPHL